MTVADHTVVGDVGFAAWKSSNAFEDVYLEPQVIERVRRAFSVFAAETTSDVHIAEREGRVIGWAARDGAPDCISDLWVDPAHQRRGVGRTLILHLLDIIADEGHPLARIQTHASNAAAVSLYERCGFTIVWQGKEFSKSMGVELEKVHLEKLPG
ncbi:ribosomal-protein-alanine N-acetyltransferase [Pseudorhizobium tarimense]|uniref:Ribosomal-protein-alanine N-acetyltransferase n=1 Tax=Pseudorhizobium tarimense TaxID=1079109 RepID=A0ABV2H5E8_9HYPH|nr:GNAT family N-acetyltransferase [Pseudorhizobium tarimense]MCJ8518946.1 GNAT family N-acetyltransferase [Pseudorhizobium tarimense]